MGRTSERLRRALIHRHTREGRAFVAGALAALSDAGAPGDAALTALVGAMGDPGASDLLGWLRAAAREAGAAPGDVERQLPRHLPILERALAAVESAGPRPGAPRASWLRAHDALRLAFAS